MVLKVLDLSDSTLGRYGSLERTYFKFLLWEGVAVLKKLNLTVSTLKGCGGLESPGFNSFYFARVWGSLKGCGGLESPGFNSFYFARVWGS